MSATLYLWSGDNSLPSLFLFLPLHVLQEGQRVVCLHTHPAVTDGLDLTLSAPRARQAEEILEQQRGPLQGSTSQPPAARRVFPAVTVLQVTAKVCGHSSSQLPSRMSWVRLQFGRAEVISPPRVTEITSAVSHRLRGKQDWTRRHGVPSSYQQSRWKGWKKLARSGRSITKSMSVVKLCSAGIKTKPSISNSS